ncbi:hypothetical protein ACGFJC_31305 [Nonomuraea fuscirosea]|uniref:hypothetical protein n=1 Tax=Nonomuraea fuscirosea TaxID=1291556 RepID=UPI0011B1D1B9|nr:hypothetical protein [Nonomuraea fuscirosea]
MTEPVPSPSDTARSRRRILYADTAACVLLAATAALLVIARGMATHGLLSTVMNIVAQACAAGAVLLLVAALWRRPGSGPFLLGPVLSEREDPERVRAQRVMRALYWKLIILRSVVGIIVLQAALTAISAILPL